jgi:hypothetical protein
MVGFHRLKAVSNCVYMMYWVNSIKIILFDLSFSKHLNQNYIYKTSEIILQNFDKTHYIYNRMRWVSSKSLYLTKSDVPSSYDELSVETDLAGRMSDL